MVPIKQGKTRLMRPLFEAMLLGAIATRYSQCIGVGARTFIGVIGVKSAPITCTLVAFLAFVRRLLEPRGFPVADSSAGWNIPFFPALGASN